MSNMLYWAKREVEIACKKENPKKKEEYYSWKSLVKFKKGGLDDRNKV